MFSSKAVYNQEVDTHRLQEVLILNRWFAGLFFFFFLNSVTVHGVTVQGHAFLEESTDHSGIEITLDESFVTPSLNFIGIGILVFVIGFSFRRRFFRSNVYSAIPFIVPFATVLLLGATTSITVLTDATGLYVFYDIGEGEYALTASKECFMTLRQAPVTVQNHPTILPDLTLLAQGLYNEAQIPADLRRIKEAQTLYNNYSMPHTYAESFACLVSGNGAGGISVLDPDFADGIVDGYLFRMFLTGEPDPLGCFWTWEADARPVDYGCRGWNSYFIDSEEICPACTVRFGDIGGLGMSK